jgi:Uma2 family endonuclease
MLGPLRPPLGVAEYLKLEVQVLSPSTQNIDLREKMMAYKALPSLSVYLLVETERLLVRHFWRGAEGKWLEQGLAGDGDIPVPCLGGVLSLPQVYRGAF